MFAKLTTSGTVEKYPYTLHELRQEYSHVSFPNNIETDFKSLLGFGVVRVFSNPKPEHDPQLQKVVEATPSNYTGRWTQVWQVVDLEQDEKAAIEANLAAENRALRNRLLTESDWTQVADAPVNKAAWATYRQALRDVTTQQGWPHTVNWPAPPAH